MKTPGAHRGLVESFHSYRALAGVVVGSLLACEPSTGLYDCSNGWCELIDRPQMAKTLRRIWGSSKDNIWAVGAAGTVVHWDSQRWEQVDVGTRSELWGVFTTGPKDTWIVGDDGALLHLDQDGWRDQGLGLEVTLSGVWGTPEGHLFVVGEEGLILHRAPGQSSFSLETCGTRNWLTTVWGSSARAVWAAGHEGTVCFYDGTAWRRYPQVGTVSITGVWGSSEKDTWSMTSFGRFYHWQNQTWDLAGLSEADTYHHGLWGTGSTLYAVGNYGVVAQQQGTRLTWPGIQTRVRQTLRGIWGESQRSLWVVGAEGIILNFQEGEN